MTSQGKKIRMERIIDRHTHRTVIVPMDHGVSMGPIQGLEDLSKATQLVADGGANAVLGHRGLALYGHRGYGKDIGLIIHLSGSSMLAPDPNNKVLLMRVEEAIKYGADAVSIHINVGAENEAEMFSMLGHVSEVCMEWGFPLIAMMYPRGEKVTNEHDVEVVKLAARIGAELGADIVKTNYTGSPETFREVVDGCPVPVVIAGGPRMDSPRDVLEMLHDSISVGAAGASIGRNVFQAPDPTAMVRAMCEVVHGEVGVDEALKLLK